MSLIFIVLGSVDESTLWHTRTLHSLICTGNWTNVICTLY